MTDPADCRVLSSYFPEDHEGLAIFRETFLTCLSPQQAAGMHSFARALYGLVFGRGAEIPGVRSPSASAHLASLAVDLRFAVVFLRVFMATFSAQTYGAERLARVRRLAASVQALAVDLEKEAKSWKDGVSSG